MALRLSANTLAAVQAVFQNQVILAKLRDIDMSLVTQSFTVLGRMTTFPNTGSGSERFVARIRTQIEKISESRLMSPDEKTEMMEARWLDEIVNDDSRYIFLLDPFVKESISRFQCAVRRDADPYSASGYKYYIKTISRHSNSAFVDGKLIPSCVWYPLEVGNLIRFAPIHPQIIAFTEANRLSIQAANRQLIPNIVGELSQNNCRVEFEFVADASPAGRARALALWSRPVVAAAAADVAPVQVAAAAAAGGVLPRMYPDLNGVIGAYNNHFNPAPAPALVHVHDQVAVEDERPKKKQRGGDGVELANLDECKEKMLKEFECIICMELMHDSVMFVKCGHSYCRCCITQWLSKDKKTCPQCNVNLTTNPRLVSVRTSNNSIDTLMQLFFTQEDHEARKKSIKNKADAAIVNELKVRAAKATARAALARQQAAALVAAQAANANAPNRAASAIAIMLNSMMGPFAAAAAPANNNNNN